MRKGEYILLYMSFISTNMGVLFTNSALWISPQNRKINTLKQFSLILFGLFLIAPNIYSQNEAFEKQLENYFNSSIPNNEYRTSNGYLENKIFKYQLFKIFNNNSSDSSSLIDEVTLKRADGSEIKYTYTYDSNGNQTLLLFQTWDGSQWVNDFQITNKYDSDGNQTLLFYETWDGSQWVNNLQISNSYDSNGNQTSALYETWDGSQWVNDFQITNAHDSNGNQTSELFETWDGSQWVINSQSTKTYDSKGNVTSELFETWDGSQWVINFQITNKYDSNGNQISELFETWDGSQWVNSSQKTNTYDSNGNQTSELYETWDGSDWVNNFQISKTYDSNKNRTSEFYETWNGSQWVSDRQIKFTYDSNGNMIFGLSERWDGSNWVVSDGSFRFEDSFGRIQSYFASEINAKYILLDIEAPVISHSPVLLTEKDKTITITANITDNEQVSNAQLFYRKGGEINFKSLDMLISGNLYSAAIPNNEVTLRGLEYYLTAKDDQSNTNREPANGIIPLQVSVSGDGLVKETAQPSGSAQTAYRLISFPLEIDNKNSTSIFDDDLGNYDKTKWRMFELGNDQTYIENSSSLKIKSGNAYWLIVNDANKNIDTGPAKSIKTNEPYTIPLNSGWTFIGNPFNYSIPLDNLSLVNNQNFTVEYYSGSWNPFGGSIQPFEGYALFTENATELLINPALSNSNLGKDLSKENVKSLWEINIVASCQTAMDSTNVAAVVPSSSKMWDNHDRPEPPIIGDYISLYFPHNDWDKISKSYSKDARPDIGDGDIWDIEVETNINDIVKLSFEKVENLPTNYEIKLIDPKFQVVIDLRSTSEYSYNNSKNESTRKLKIIIGNKEFVNSKIEQEIITPTSFQLYQNYPNPFNPSTVVRFSLPTEEKLTLKIYNMLGQEIIKLIDNEFLSSGYHQTNWNGTDTYGKTVSSGIYIYSLKAGKYSSSKKMIFMK